ncbi:MAG: DUF4429 domain-containing protein [Ilumatobacteraceae bacterium]|nr:DUF4429 domain-containing protein [Ilumatobacteraceae bacterium]
MEVKGHGGSIVVFDGRSVLIKRKGALSRMTVGKGEKQIPLSSVTAVQWKPAGRAVNGYIQFTIAGGNESRSSFGTQTFDAAGDENSVLFTRKQMLEFEKLRAAIEAARDQPTPETSRPAAPPPLRIPDPPAAPPAPTVAERMAQLTQLRDQGLVTPEEFEAKRAAIIESL